MSIDGKPNGKVWRTTTIIGIPIVGLIAVFATWTWSGGALANRVDRNEQDISEIKAMYQKTASDIVDIKVMLAGMQ